MAVIEQPEWAALLLDGSTVSGTLNDVFSVYAYERRLPWDSVTREMVLAMERNELVPLNKAASREAPRLIDPPRPSEWWMRLNTLDAIDRKVREPEQPASAAAKPAAGRPADWQEPDWTKTGTRHHGGELTDIPEPHIRLYPHEGLRRPVRIRITQLQLHYHVSMVEGRNPVWDGTGWREPNGDAEGAGQSFHPSFDLFADARRFIAETVAEHFPVETHQTDTDISAALDEDEYVGPDYLQEARRAARRARSGD